MGKRKETLTLLKHVTQSLATHFDTDEPGLVENSLHLRRDDQVSVVLWICQVIWLVHGRLVMLCSRSKPRVMFMDLSISIR